MSDMSPSTTERSAYWLTNGDKISGAHLLAILDDYDGHMWLDGSLEKPFNRSVLPNLADDREVETFQNETFTCEFWSHSDSWGSGQGVRFQNSAYKSSDNTTQVVSVEIGNPPRCNGTIPVGPSIAELPGMAMDQRKLDLAEFSAPWTHELDVQAYVEKVAELKVSDQRRQLGKVAEQARPHGSDLASPEEYQARRSRGRAI